MIVTIKDVEKAVCLRFKMDRGDLLGSKRARAYSRPRQIAMFLCREMTDASLPRIGQHFCRDHTTVLHACRRITKLVAERPKVAEYVQECREVVATSDRWKEALRATMEAIPNEMGAA